MSHDVAVIIGSLRANAYSRRLAAVLRSVTPPALTLRVAEIGDLPLYNSDLDSPDADAPPPAWVRFRHDIATAAAVLFVTPEYNRSVPGALKNAIDVGSRPQGASVFGGKPAAVISQSPGAIGGFGANHAIRQSLVFLDMPVLQQPEAYIGHINNSLDANGQLTNEGTRKFLTGFMEKFAQWIERFVRA